MSETMQELPTASTGEILIYTAPSGEAKLEVRLAEETVWLTQLAMAELLQTTKHNVGQHLKNIFEEGELAEDSVVKKFFTTASDGKNKWAAFYA